MVKKELSGKSNNESSVHKSPDKFVVEINSLTKEETRSASKESANDDEKITRIQKKSLTISNSSSLN